MRKREVHWKESSLTSTSQSRKRPPLVSQLCIFFDKEDSNRCGGRIHNVLLTEFIVNLLFTFLQIIILSGEYTQSNGAAYINNHLKVQYLLCAFDS